MNKETVTVAGKEQNWIDRFEKNIWVIFKNVCVVCQRHLVAHLKAQIQELPRKHIVEYQDDSRILEYI